MSEPIDVVFTFDTTGSMAPALTQVRRDVTNTVKRLFKDIPNLRVGIGCHGDYCDARSTYVTKWLDLTTDQERITRFINDTPSTGGGDSPECYELVLHEARSLSWGSGRTKVLAMIGDDEPHPPSYPMNTKKIDWRNEAGLLKEAGVNVYAVQCLGYRHSRSFWAGLAKATDGLHLELDQFASVRDLIMAICYKQNAANDAGVGLKQLDNEVRSRGDMSRSVDAIFAILLGRDTAKEMKKADLTAVPGGRFQVLYVDRDTDIKSFVEKQGLRFRKGRGFYQWTKKETVQGYKEILLRSKATGDFFEGTRARDLMGLPPQTEKGSSSANIDLRPEKLAEYVAFVQSTSVNRRLIGGTYFLYEVEEWVERMKAAA